MKTTLLTFATIAFSLFSHAQMPSSAPTGEKCGVLMHVKKNGSITKTDGSTVNGKISYREYGERTLIFYPEGGEDSTIIESLDKIQSIMIDDRGTFHSIYAFEGAKAKTLALVESENEAYIEYKKFTHNPMRIEPTDPEVMIQGTYEYYVKNKRTGETVGAKYVTNLKKKIRDHIDYCDQIAEKVEKKEKGYKVTLLKRDYDILKDCILEANKVCPAE